MSTVSDVAGHTPLVFVHTIELVPVVNPVTKEVFEPGVVTLPPPLNTDHVATPIAGMLALRFVVVVVKQNA